MHPAYIAGLFDGEGSLYITETMQVRLSITNTYRPILDILAKEFGGTVTKCANNGTRKRNCFVWQLCDERMKLLLELIQPFLVIKSGHASIALLTIKERSGKCPGVAIPDSVMEVVAKYKLVMDRLNHREYD